MQPVDGLGSHLGTTPSHVQLEGGAWNAKIFLEIFNLHTLASPIDQMKDKHLVHLPSKSDF